MKKHTRVGKRTESEFVAYLTAIYCMTINRDDYNPVIISKKIYEIATAAIDIASEQHMHNILVVFSNMNNEQKNIHINREKERVERMKYIATIEMPNISLSFSKSYQEAPFTLGSFEVPYNSPTKSHLERSISRINRIASASSN